MNNQVAYLYQAIERAEKEVSIDKERFIQEPEIDVSSIRYKDFADRRNEVIEMMGNICAQPHLSFSAQDFAELTQAIRRLAIDCNRKITGGEDPDIHDLWCLVNYLDKFTEKFHKVNEEKDRDKKLLNNFFSILDSFKNKDQPSDDQEINYFITKIEEKKDKTFKRQGVGNASLTFENLNDMLKLILEKEGVADNVKDLYFQRESIENTDELEPAMSRYHYNQLDFLKKIISKLFLTLNATDLNQERIKDFINYFIINKKELKDGNLKDWNLELLKLISDRYKLSILSNEEIFKVLTSDISFLESKFKEDKEVITLIQKNLLNKLLHKSDDPVKDVLNEYVKDTNLDPDLKKIIYRFVANNFESNGCIKLLDMFAHSKRSGGGVFNYFLNFYHKCVRPIDLSILSSGKLFKFKNILQNSMYYSMYLDYVFGAIKLLQVKDDEKIIGMIRRGDLICAMLHNNNYRLPQVSPAIFDFTVSSDLDQSTLDLFLSMISSRWDMSQDVTNKFINVGLNQKIDKMIERNDNKAKKIADALSIDLNSLRQNLIEIRGIISNGDPIPFSWKEKIYKIDSDLNSILSGELILQYGPMAKPKDKKLFQLNYQLENGLKFEVLPDMSLDHFKVGAATQCCQRPGGAAETAMIDSFINPLAGVLVLKKDREIIAQSYFHYVPQDNAYILDNVEANFSLVKLYKINLDNLYANLAQKLQQDYQVAYVKCATEKEYNKLKDNSFSMDKMEKDPRYFELTKLDGSSVYKDFKTQKHIELTKPTFDLTPVTMTKKQASRLERLIKLAQAFSTIAILRNSRYGYLT